MPEVSTINQQSRHQGEMTGEQRTPFQRKSDVFKKDSLDIKDDTLLPNIIENEGQNSETSGSNQKQIVELTNSDYPIAKNSKRPSIKEYSLDEQLVYPPSMNVAIDINSSFKQNKNSSGRNTQIGISEGTVGTTQYPKKIGNLATSKGAGPSNQQTFYFSSERSNQDSLPLVQQPKVVSKQRVNIHNDLNRTTVARTNQSGSNQESSGSPKRQFTQYNRHYKPTQDQIFKEKVFSGRNQSRRMPVAHSMNLKQNPAPHNFQTQAKFNKRPFEDNNNSKRNYWQSSDSGSFQQSMSSVKELLAQKQRQMRLPELSPLDYKQQTSATDQSILAFQFNIISPQNAKAFTSNQSKQVITQTGQQTNESYDMGMGGLTQETRKYGGGIRNLPTGTDVLQGFSGTASLFKDKVMDSFSDTRSKEKKAKAHREEMIFFQTQNIQNQDKTDRPSKQLNSTQNFVFNKKGKATVRSQIRNQSITSSKHNEPKSLREETYSDARFKPKKKDEDLVNIEEEKTEGLASKNLRGRGIFKKMESKGVQIDKTPNESEAALQEVESLPHENDSQMIEDVQYDQTRFSQDAMSNPEGGAVTIARSTIQNSKLDNFDSINRGHATQKQSPLKITDPQKRSMLKLSNNQFSFGLQIGGTTSSVHYPPQDGKGISLNKDSSMQYYNLTKQSMNQGKGSMNDNVSGNSTSIGNLNGRMTDEAISRIEGGSNMAGVNQSFQDFLTSIQFGGGTNQQSVKALVQPQNRNVYNSQAIIMHSNSTDYQQIESQQTYVQNHGSEIGYLDLTQKRSANPLPGNPAPLNSLKLNSINDTSSYAQAFQSISNQSNNPLDVIKVDQNDYSQKKNFKGGISSYIPKTFSPTKPLHTSQSSESPIRQRDQSPQKNIMKLKRKELQKKKKNMTLMKKDCDISIVNTDSMQAISSLGQVLDYRKKLTKLNKSNDMHRRTGKQGIIKMGGVHPSKVGIDMDQERSKTQTNKILDKAIAMADSFIGKPSPSQEQQSKVQKAGFQKMELVNKQRLEYIKKIEDQVDADQNIKKSDLGGVNKGAILEMRDGEVKEPSSEQEEIQEEVVPFEVTDQAAVEHVLKVSSSFQHVFDKERTKAEMEKIDKVKKQKEAAAKDQKDAEVEKLPQINKSERITNKEERSFTQFSSREKGVIIEQMVIESSELHQKQKEYVKNKLQIDLNKHVSRIVKSQKKELVQSYDEKFNLSQKKPGQIGQGTQHLPFSLPSVTSSREEKAQEENSAELRVNDALDFIRKRLGFVNKKLQLQQKINFMINDLVEKKHTEKFEKKERKRQRLEDMERSDMRQVETINDTKLEKEEEGEVKIVKSNDPINKDLKLRVSKSPGVPSADLGQSPDKYSEKFESEKGEIDHFLPELDEITEEKEWSKQTPFNDSDQDSLSKRYGGKAPSTCTKRSPHSSKQPKKAGRKQVSQSVQFAKNLTQQNFSPKKEQKQLSKAQMIGNTRSMHRTMMMKINMNKNRNLYHREKLDQRKEEVNQLKKDALARQTSRKTRNQSLIDLNRKSQIQKQHNIMLNQLNKSINSVDLSDYLRMHLQRKKTSVTYKLDKKKSISPSKSEFQSMESPKKSLKNSLSPTHSPEQTPREPNSSWSRKKKPLKLNNLRAVSEAKHDEDIMDDSLFLSPDTSEKSINFLENWTNLDLVRGADPRLNQEIGSIKEQFKSILKQIDERYNIYKDVVERRRMAKKQPGNRESVSQDLQFDIFDFILPHHQKLLEDEDLDSETREMIFSKAEEQRDNYMARKKQDEIEKRLAKMERSGGMSANDIMKMMNDDMLIERYTKHLNNLLFKFADPFLKSKFQTWLAQHDPTTTLSFFQRMTLDKKQRELRQEKRIQADDEEEKEKQNFIEIQHKIEEQRKQAKKIKQVIEKQVSKRKGDETTSSIATSAINSPTRLMNSFSDSSPIKLVKVCPSTTQPIKLMGGENQ